MAVEPIEDLADARVAIYRNVRDSRMRDERGLFLAESRLCVRRLLELRRHRVHSIFVTPVALDALQDVLPLEADSFPVYLASADLMKHVVGFNLHRGCIAAAERGAVPHFESLLNVDARLIVGLEGVANPENVGNVFRNAAAFGADAVFLSSDCADPLYRKAIRVSMGASLRIPFARVRDWPGALERIRSAGWVSLAFSTAPEAEDLVGVGPDRATRGLALLFGGEADGLRPVSAGAADRLIRIPMAKGVDSLNVATASGVALHHAFRLLSEDD